MGIDRSEITFDGSECNKVGTSYTGFNGQANKCNMQVSSCFQNQLYDLHKKDIQRLANNQQPLHFMSRYGKFSTVTYSNEKYLEMELTGTFASMITVELNADSLKFITTVSKGVIDFAEITNFEALTLNGVLVVQITNVGNIVASFKLSVFCSPGVSPVPEQPVSLGVMETKQTSFQITVINELEAGYKCNVTLYNSIGKVSDVKPVFFNTTDRSTNLGTEGGYGNRPSGTSGSNNTKVNLSCAEYCPS